MVYSWTLVNISNNSLKLIILFFKFINVLSDEIQRGGTAPSQIRDRKNQIHSTLARIYNAPAVFYQNPSEYYIQIILYFYLTVH